MGNLNLSTRPVPINTLVHRKQLGNVFIYTVKKIRRREKANK